MSLQDGNLGKCVGITLLWSLYLNGEWLTIQLFSGQMIGYQVGQYIGVTVVYNLSVCVNDLLMDSFMVLPVLFAEKVPEGY